MSIIPYINRDAPFALDPAIALLGNEREGAAYDWLANRAYVRDRGNPANFYLGDAAPHMVSSRATGGSYWDKDGVLRWAAANEPRLDHDPVTGEARGLLIEPAGTNLVFPSETFSVSSGVGSVSKTAAAPDGTANATILTEAPTTGEHFVNDKVVSVVAGEYLTWSYFVKKSPTGASRNACIRMAGGLIARSYFDPNNGAWVGAGSENHFVSRGFEVLANGWYRVWVTGLAPANGSVVCRVQMTTGTSGSYTGDGVSGMIVWGRQAEKATAPSSYIPTTTAETTRAADVAKIPLASIPWGAGVLTLNGAPAAPIIDGGDLDVSAMCAAAGATHLQTLKWVPA